MKKTDVDFRKVAEYIAKSIDKFYPWETVRLKTMWDRKHNECYSYLSLERDSLNSTNGKYNPTSESIGTTMYLYAGCYKKSEDDALESLVMNFINYSKNEINIHSLSQIVMKMELEGFE